ncbi:conjugative transposon protein TraM [Flavobacterium beibuense]|uniref:Conjugative transposon protein TraM n=1 Tax=Flavobacterium beibuense TaxID=657326 RepID=A0A444WEV5_9FLAO|nr:conjugative transposon protein TraM [Flavobacterium beibuense]RYJ44312.1 Conjugative transposon protein TraM [Flavobacterium beibuense]
MENRKDSQGGIRQRKLLLVLPLLALPFVTLLFWIMGGGKGEVTDSPEVRQGFNIKLPQSRLTGEDPMNKLNYYDRAALDSMKFEELKKKDPNYRVPTTEVQDSLRLHEFPNRKKGLIMSSYRDPNEEKVYEKLEALKRAISAPPPLAEKTKSNYRDHTLPPLPVRSQEMESIMESLDNGIDGDQELKQISGMLENILDIQYPGRMQEKLRKASEAERGRVFPVFGTNEAQPVTLLQGADTRGNEVFVSRKKTNGFYSLEESAPNQNAQIAAITAVIAETQTIVNGTVIKMRLTQEISINGTKIPKNVFIYGTCSLKGERLEVNIPSIRYNNTLFPVELSIYDLDGLSGIFIPGAITRDVAKASADRSMQTLGVSALEDSWEAQAAGAGFEAAKSLFSKKVKQVKVVLKAGYQVLLRDEKQKDKS